MTTDASLSAKTIIYGMGSMFKDMQGLTALTWMLSGYLKNHIGFLPNLYCVGSSQSGKTTLLNVLNKLRGEHESVRFIDEISRTKPSELQVLAKQLKVCYKSPASFVWNAGVFGQALPSNLAAIDSRFIAIDLDRSKGDLYEPTEPFPVQAWTDWLIATQNEDNITQMLNEYVRWIFSNNQNLEEIFLENYAAMMVAADLLFKFADIQDIDYSNKFKQALLNQCSQHMVAISESKIPTKKFVFEGYSDDSLHELEQTQESIDCFDAVAQFKLVQPSSKSGLIVTGMYCSGGSWMLGTRLFDCDKPVDWQVRTELYDYKNRLIVIAPADAVLTPMQLIQIKI